MHLVSCIMYNKNTFTTYNKVKVFGQKEKAENYAKFMINQQALDYQITQVYIESEWLEKIQIAKGLFTTIDNLSVAWINKFLLNEEDKNKKMAKKAILIQNGLLPKEVL